MYAINSVHREREERAFQAYEESRASPSPAALAAAVTFGGTSTPASTKPAGEPSSQGKRPPPPKVLARQRSFHRSLADSVLPGLSGLSTSPPAVRVIGPSQHIYEDSAGCGCMAVSQWPRSACIHLVEASWFEPFILLVIFLNCAAIATESPLEPASGLRASLLHLGEQASVAIFTVEMLVKLIAYGVPFYAHDGFCRLDFATVVLAWAVFIMPSLGSFTMIRALRGLRPLRALQHVPGMPSLVRAILHSLPRVYNVVVLVAFLLLVSGVVGVELFQGRLHYRCATPDGADLGYICDPRRANETVGAARTSTGAGYDGRCPRGSSCTHFGSNPDDGLTSFDSVGMSLLSSLRVLSMDNWSHIMYAPPPVLMPRFYRAAKV